MKIIAIVGPAGAGKDTAARMLSEITGIPLLVSYTTRPMREGEVNGREHHFVASCNTPHEDMLAYTEYGGYEYWTEVSQVKDTAIYVIDEDGLRSMMKRFPFINVTSIHIEANRLTRRMRGVSCERMMRDDVREQFPADYFTYRLTNNGSLDELHTAMLTISDTLTKH